MGRHGEYTRSIRVLVVADLGGTRSWGSNPLLSTPTNREVVMAEVIWHETIDHRAAAEQHLKEGGDRGGVVISDHRRSIWAGPGKVAKTFSVFHMGMPRHHPDKRFYIWQTIESFGFRRLSTGTVVPYHVRRDAKPRRGIPWRNVVAAEPFNRLGRTEDGDDVFTNAVRDEFGIRDFTDLFPAAPQMGIYKYRAMPWMFRGAYRQPDIEQFTKAVYGKTRYTDALGNLIPQVSPTMVALTSQMRGLAQMNDIVEFLEGCVGEEEDNFMSVPALRKMWLAINPESFQYLLRANMDMKQRQQINRLSNYTRRDIDYVIRRLDKTRVYKTYTDLVY